MPDTSKVKSIVVDTLTAIQENQFMRDRKKPNHDKWKDYGTAIFNFNLDLQELGFESILVIGQPGTGKSSGMRTLPHDTNVWFNVDNKNPVWTGGKREYGRKTNPRGPYHIIPKTYKEILDHIKFGLEKGMFEEDKYAFLIGHIETFKEGNDHKARLKTLGNLATKMQLEGRLETVLYANVEIVEGKPEYLLYTHNNGFNTVRTPQDLFEGKIPNDFKLVLDKLSSDY